MKTRIILGIAIIAVAGVNAYLANENGLFTDGSDLTMDNLENAAEAAECMDEVADIVNGRVVSYRKVYCDNSSDKTCSINGRTDGVYIDHVLGFSFTIPYTCTGEYKE